MKPTTIYLVAEQTGEGSMKGHRPVCAYGDREQAEAHVAALMMVEEAAESLRREYMKAGEGENGETETFMAWRKRQSVWVNCEALDPYFDGDSTYVVVEVDLWRHFDEFQGLE